MGNTQTSSIDSFQPLLESSRKHLQWPKWRLQRWQTEYWGLRSADYIRTTANLEKRQYSRRQWTLTELGFPRSSAIKFVVSLWNSAGTSLTFVDNSKTGIFKETRIQRSLKVLQLAPSCSPSCGPWNQEIRCVRRLKMSFKFLDFLYDLTVCLVLLSSSSETTRGGTPL